MIAVFVVTNQSNPLLERYHRSSSDNLLPPNPPLTKSFTIYHNETSSSPDPIITNETREIVCIDYRIRKCKTQQLTKLDTALPGPWSAVVLLVIYHVNFKLVCSNFGCRLFSSNVTSRHSMILHRFYLLKT